MKIQVLITICLTLAISAVKGQNSPTEVSDRFFAICKTDSIDKAIDYLFSTNKYSNESQTQINTIKDNLTKTGPFVGPFSGYELLSSKGFGKDIMLLTFVVKYERTPLFFKFLFYKPHEKWQIQNFNFESKSIEELKDVN